MASLLYKPIGIIAGIVTGKLAAALLRQLWAVFAREDLAAPHPARRDVSDSRAVASAVVQAATFAATKTVVDRAGYRAFEYATGASPRPKAAKKEEKAAAGIVDD